MASWIKTLVGGCALALMVGAAHAQDLAPLNSDTETDRINWSELQGKFGEVPAAPEGTADRRRLEDADQRILAQPR